MSLDRWLDRDGTQLGDYGRIRRIGTVEYVLRAGFRDLEDQKSVDAVGPLLQKIVLEDLPIRIGLNLPREEESENTRTTENN